MFLKMVREESKYALLVTLLLSNKLGKLSLQSTNFVSIFRFCFLFMSWKDTFIRSFFIAGLFFSRSYFYTAVCAYQKFQYINNGW